MDHRIFFSVLIYLCNISYIILFSLLGSIFSDNSVRLSYLAPFIAQDLIRKIIPQHC